MKYHILRRQRPRLYRAVDDADYLFPSPKDEQRKLMLHNLIHSCAEYMDAEPPLKVPQLENSPFPYHNLYLCFYNALMGQSMIEQFSFAYLMTKDARYAERARTWIRALLGWDYTINTFYSSARVMHALAVAEDWLGDELTSDDIQKMHTYNIGLCQKHEHEIDQQRGSIVAGGHPTLYASHFGIAALTLLEIIPEAERWLDWSIEKFETALLPYGVSEDGTFNPDGNWSLAYALYSKFLFMDALKNVTGIDLYEKYKSDIDRSFHFLQYAYVGGSVIESKRVYGPDENLLTGYWQLDNFSPPIMKLAAVSRNPYAQWVATRDPNLGRIQHTDSVVKMGMECTFAWGPFAYLWYDPTLESSGMPALTPSRLFPDGEYAILRSGWEEPIMVIGYQGRRDVMRHLSQTFVVHWAGRPLLVDAPTPESIPVQEGNAPAMGGEMELRGDIETMVESDEGDYLRIQGFLTTQEMAMIRGNLPGMMIRITSRQRTDKELALLEENGQTFARLGKNGYLQYQREGNLCAEGGAIRIVFRMNDSEVNDDQPLRILFSVGKFYHGGSAFHLGFINGKLTWRVKHKMHQNDGCDQQLDDFKPEAGKWYEVWGWWSGLNGSAPQSFSGLRVREMGTADSSVLYEKAGPIEMVGNTIFHTQPNSTMWIGSAVQVSDSSACMDLRQLEIYGAEAVKGNVLDPKAVSLLFKVDYEQGKDAIYAVGSGTECAEGPLELRMHPHQKANLTEKGAELIHDHAKLKMIPIGDDGMNFSLESIPFVLSGYAGEAMESKPEQHTRLVVKPSVGRKEMMLAMLPEGFNDDALKELVKQFEKIKRNDGRQ